MIVTPEPLDRLHDSQAPLLFLDLSGSDQILRARIFDLLLKQRLYEDEGSLHRFIWDLLQKTAPQAFRMHIQGRFLWLALEK